jgi:hypothetical protein
LRLLKLPQSKAGRLPAGFVTKFAGVAPVFSIAQRLTQVLNFFLNLEKKRVVGRLHRGFDLSLAQILL